MQLSLLKEGNPKLLEVSQPWDFTVDGDPSELIKEMARIMFESLGVGIAAPQVGLQKRLFVMGNRDKLFACINPEIISGEGKVRDIEGCLSFPELWLKVDRYETINVRYQVVTGDWVEERMSGIMARIFQHERDHLDGICFDTKVAKLSLQMAKERRKKKSR